MERRALLRLCALTAADAEHDVRSTTAVGHAVVGHCC